MAHGMIRTKSPLRRFGRGWRLSAGVAAAIAVTLATAGCTSSRTTSGPGEFDSAGPMKLAPATQGGAASGADVTLGEVDQAELRKALERYRIGLEREQSPVETAGVDLTGDGIAEVLVLYTGPGWCTTTGCSFVVFQSGERGYSPVSRTTRVRGPVMIGPGSNSGWRDLIVKTGGGAAPVRHVRLGFTGNGYPKNALLQPGPTESTLSQSTEVIPEADFRATAAQTSSAQ